MWSFCRDGIDVQLALPKSLERGFISWRHADNMSGGAAIPSDTVCIGMIQTNVHHFSSGTLHSCLASSGSWSASENSPLDGVIITDG